MTFDFGESGLFYSDNTSTRGLTINLETSLTIFEAATLMNPRFDQNAIGCYSMVRIGSDGTAKFASLGTPEFSIRPRSKRCSWNPLNGKMDFSTGEIRTCPYEIQRQLCTDVLWDSCWEKLLGRGQGIYDWDATAELTDLVRRVLNQEMKGYSNDLYLIATWANHPWIEKAKENQWYKEKSIDKDAFDRFYEMTMSCSVGGHMTSIDQLSTTEDYGNYHFEITEVDDNFNYIGTPTELFDQLKETASHELVEYGKAVSSQTMPVVGTANPDGRPIIKVSKSIFNAYKKELRQTFNGIEAGFYITLYGEAYGCESCGPRQMKGMLYYDDCIIYCASEWDLIERMTCVKSHRAVMMAPGVLGIAYDVLPTAEGIGIDIVRWDIAPYKGQTMIDAYFKIGAEILDPTYVASAITFVYPEN